MRYRLLGLFVLGCLLSPLQVSASGVEARRTYIARSYEVALQTAKPAAENGDSTAMLVLGMLYFEGKGVDRDYKAALKWWRASAELGNSWAQNNIGTLFEKGLGVSQDYQEASKWFESSAQKKRTLRL